MLDTVPPFIWLVFDTDKLLEVINEIKLLRIFKCCTQFLQIINIILTLSCGFCVLQCVSDIPAVATVWAMQVTWKKFNIQVVLSACETGYGQCFKKWQTIIKLLFVSVQHKNIFYYFNLLTFFQFPTRSYF
jgi:hypothetical protein